MTRLLIPLAILLATDAAYPGEVERLSFAIPRKMSRADVYVARPVPRPKGVLVLCPGWNGNGASLAQDPNWLKLAKENDLGVLGISFASDPEKFYEGHIYYHADQGSGQVLLDAVRKAFNGDLPIVIYGFSAGADFVSHFIQWKPDRVAAWCAYSPAWYIDPAPGTKLPPGLVACGDHDPRLGAALTYFKRGRAAANKWLWIGVPDSAHSAEPAVLDFVRAYLSIVWKGDSRNGLWVDIDTENKVTIAAALAQPSLAAWLPEQKLLLDWRKLNEP
jgi:pimeloyl-ACP methyl ester carboxylesterase